MNRPSAFRRYFLPGFVFQSVVIAGGYGTGRELAEFFLSQGPLGGVLAIFTTTVVWSAVAMATFEFARLYQAYDYRHFFQHLLGRGWFLFEVCYVMLLLIVLAVVAAAAGSIIEETFGIGYWVGVAGIMTAVAALVFGGSAVIEKALSAWSFVLYGVYLIFFFWCLQRFGPRIGDAFAHASLGSGWFLAGVRYAGYNLALVPAILFTISEGDSPRDTLVAGALAGPIAMIPGLLFFVAMVGEYPGILERTIPANQLLEALGSRAFQITFQVVLFGTLIETGTGLIHAVNERIAGVLRDRSTTMPAWVRPAVGLVFLAAGTAIARFGLIGLIARGYGTLTWLFIAVYVVPVLTLGVWRIRRFTVPVASSPQPTPLPPSDP